MLRMQPETADRLVRAGVARAEHLRRSREAGRRMWRLAPIVAAACVCGGGVSRLAGWSPLVPFSVLTIAIAALCAYAYSARFDRAVSDTVAAEIDARAGLGGELRSASWFASHDTRDPWIDHHLGRAAERVGAIDWTLLYPAVQARGAKVASGVLLLAALALTLPILGRSSAFAGVSAIASATHRPASMVASLLPADLQKKLEELLRMAERGGRTGDGTPLSDAELRDLLSRLGDLKKLHGLHEIRQDAAAAGNTTRQDAENLKALAERAKRASEMSSLSPEVRDALSQVADKLSELSDTAQSTKPRDPQDAIGGADAPKGDAAQSNKPGANDDMSVQAVKDPAAAGGVGVIMMSSDNASRTSEPGLGLGGGSAPNNGGGHMADLGAALRRETIEAKEDAAGDNVDTEVRRQTDRGDATVAYANTAPRAFERGRSTAPPAVPEGRRATMRSYFTRKR
jgi:hypothetical protein